MTEELEKKKGLKYIEKLIENRKKNEKKKEKEMEEFEYVQRLLLRWEKAYKNSNLPQCKMDQQNSSSEDMRCMTIAEYSQGIICNMVNSDKYYEKASHFIDNNQNLINESVNYDARLNCNKLSYQKPSIFLTLFRRSRKNYRQRVYLDGTKGWDWFCKYD